MLRTATKCSRAPLNGPPPAEATLPPGGGPHRRPRRPPPVLLVGRRRDGRDNEGRPLGRPASPPPAVLFFRLAGGGSPPSKTIQRRGIGRQSRMGQTLKKGSRVTGEARTEIAATVKRQYDRGESIRDIAEAAGRSYGFVHRLLSENGVKFRDRGGANGGAGTRRKATRVARAQMDFARLEPAGKASNRAGRGH